MRARWPQFVDSAFKYVERPTSEAGRLDNPLGFQVESYRADPEIGQ